MLSRRSIHTATTLADGSVLIAGGYDEVNASSYILPLGSMERFLPASNTFVPAGGMATRRAFHAAAALQDGRVLLAGGSSQSWMSGNTVELYDPLHRAGAEPGRICPTLMPGSPYAPVVTLGLRRHRPASDHMLCGSLPPGMTWSERLNIYAGGHACGQRDRNLRAWSPGYRQREPQEFADADVQCRRAQYDHRARID